MGIYNYEGAVLCFNNVLTSKWRDQTSAVSKKKAMSNMCYHYKKQNGLTSNTKISLPGKIIET